MTSSATRGWQDCTSGTRDRKDLQRINRLIAEAERDPAFGTGKRE